MVELSGYLAEIGVSVRRNASDPDGVSIETRDGAQWWQGVVPLKLPSNGGEAFNQPCVFEPERGIALICLFNDPRPDQLRRPREFILSDDGQNYGFAPRIRLSLHRQEGQPARTKIDWDFDPVFHQKQVHPVRWPEGIDPAPSPEESRLNALIELACVSLCLFGGGWLWNSMDP